MVQIPEAQGDSTQMLQASVDGPDRPVRRTDVEERQNVVPTVPQSPTQLRQLLQPFSVVPSLTWLKLVSSPFRLPMNPIDQFSEFLRQWDRRDSLMPADVDSHLAVAA